MNNANTITLLIGTYPNSGKTNRLIEKFTEELRAGHHAVYITLEETPEAIARRIAKQVGNDNNVLAAYGKQCIIVSMARDKVLTDMENTCNIAGAKLESGIDSVYLDYAGIVSNDKLPEEYISRYNIIAQMLLYFSERTGIKVVTAFNDAKINLPNDMKLAEIEFAKHMDMHNIEAYVDNVNAVEHNTAADEIVNSLQAKWSKSEPREITLTKEEAQQLYAAGSSKVRNILLTKAKEDWFTEYVEKNKRNAFYGAMEAMLSYYANGVRFMSDHGTYSVLPTKIIAIIDKNQQCLMKIDFTGDSQKIVLRESKVIAEVMKSARITRNEFDTFMKEYAKVKFNFDNPKIEEIL